VKLFKQLVVSSFVLCAGFAQAQVTAYRDEVSFLNALSAQGFVPVQESFEDDAVWGAVRTTIVGGQFTAPSITNLGLTWSSISPNNGITTGSGPARTGQWGFFQLPHYDVALGLGDGWRGVGDQPLVAIGGWIDSNTPPAKLGLFLDGVAVDYGNDDALGGGPHQFFGAVAPAGFAAFEFRELEGKPLDLKFVFADDFTFAFDGVIVDCNGNGIADVLDIAAGSPDCNLNNVLDECELTGDDCNGNGVLDSCEAVTTQSYPSPLLSPIGNGSPQAFTVVSPPLSSGNVTLTFTALANLGGQNDRITVDINGTLVGTVFGPDGSDCPKLPDAAQLVVPASTFNDAVAGGDAVIHMVASAEVDPAECAGANYITVQVDLLVPSNLDSDGNGVLDQCETAFPSFCLGDGSEGACPCGNTGVAGHGCDIAQGTGGVRLDVLAQAPGVPNRATLRGTGFPSMGAPTAIVIRGAALDPASPVAFGDGLRCVGTPLVRLAASFASGGTSEHTVGHGSAAGPGTFFYQLWFRNTPAGFCTPEAFNLSSGRSLTW